MSKAKVVNKCPTQTLPGREGFKKVYPPGGDLEGATLGLIKKIPTFAATLVHWFI